VASGQKFGCLYVDPPWEYGNRTSNGAAVNHYPTLTDQELALLPVSELAAPDSHCHLWTTTVHLPTALGLLSAWGFQYKSVFVWVKEGLGLGNYWRVSTEFLLLGVRGNAPFADHGQPNWLATPSRRCPLPLRWCHSAASCAAPVAARSPGCPRRARPGRPVGRAEASCRACSAASRSLSCRTPTTGMSGTVRGRLRSLRARLAPAAGRWAAFPRALRGRFDTAAARAHSVCVPSYRFFAPSPRSPERRTPCPGLVSAPGDS
jgi:hypothetical protein